nr:hypothetical protein [Tanacetum cinerariifolium]
MNMGQDRQMQMIGEEYDLMADAADLDEIEEVNANCILMANLQQASSSGTQTDSAPVYDSDGSVEVHENYNDNEIFNMFTQEEQYTELLEPIPKPQQVPQNDNNVISEVTDGEQGGETVDQHSVNFKETHALYESLYQNLAIEVEKGYIDNSNPEEDDEDPEEDPVDYPANGGDNDDNESSDDNDDDDDVKKDGEVDEEEEHLAPVDPSVVPVVDPVPSKKHDPPAVYDSEETLKLAQESHKKMRFLKKEIKPANYAKINHLSGVFVPQTTKSKEELFLSNISNMVTVPKTISITNEDLSDDTTPSVAQKFLNEVFEHKDNTCDTSVNTKFAKQSAEETLPKLDEIHALSKPVTSNSVSTPQDSKGMNNDKVIAPGMFRISPDKVSREAKKVPNTVSASSRTKPITVSQPNVITKKNVNSNLNGLSSIGLDNTKTRRPQPRSNTKNDRVPSASKSRRSKNKEAKVEEHHRNLLLSKNNEHMSSACNNFKLDSQDVISKVVCAVCKKCLNSINHDVCLNNYVNGNKSCSRKHKANVSKNETQQKNQPKIKKPKK